MRLTIQSMQNLAIGYIAIWATSPILAYGDVYRAAAILAVLVWIFLEIVRKKGIFLRPTKIFLLAIFFIIYQLLIELLFGNVEYIVYHFQTWIFLFFILVYESWKHKPESQNTVLWVLLCTMPLWLFFTLYTLLTENAHAARTIVRSSEEAIELTGQGVGGYALVYSMVILLPVLLEIVLRKKKLFFLEAPSLLKRLYRGPELIIWSNIILGSAVILLAGYSIAIITTIVGIIVVLFANRIRPINFFLILLFLLPSILLLSYPLLSILKYILPMVEGTAYAAKVNDVIYGFEYLEFSGTAELRAERYLRSLDLFFENPFLGVLSLDPIGKHSAVLDVFARYGVLIGIIFFILITIVPLRAIGFANGSYGLAYSILLVTLFIAFLNNISASMAPILFLAFPVVANVKKI